VGGGEIEIKAKLSPAEAGVWAELGKKLSNPLSATNFCKFYNFTNL
jgi:hypothetical protein